MGLAPPRLRALARVLDIAFIAAAAMLGSAIVNSIPNETTAGFVVLPLFLYVFGHEFLHALLGGQTFGKKIVGIRVVRDRDRLPIGWGTAFNRLIGLWILGLVPLGIGYLVSFVGMTDRLDGQMYHDRLAGTLVVRVEPRT